MSISKIGLIVLMASLASADSITTVDSRIWNGTVTKAQGSQLTLRAQFTGQTPTLTFGAEFVRSIQFNSTMYNPGGVTASRPGGATLSGTIYLRKQAGKSRPPLSCQDITLDGHNVYCAGKQIGTKQDVVQILVGR